ncbi:MAG: isochorismatase family cysteine hydrolase [Caldilineaceae bacterium]
MSYGLIKTATVEIPEIPVKPSMTLAANKTAIIVVDMQNDFVKSGGSLVVPDAMATVPAIQDLLMRGRAKGIKVAYTQDSHMEGDKEWTIWPRHTEQGTWGWQIIDELAPQPGDLICPKPRYDGFYGTQLDHYLSNQWGVENVVIVGTISSICVLHTAAGAGLRWYQVVVPADASSALNDFDQALTLRQVSWLYFGNVVGSGKDVHFK